MELIPNEYNIIWVVIQAQSGKIKSRNAYSC